MKAIKTLVMLGLAVVLAALASSAVTANPYLGYNVIGNDDIYSSKYSTHRTSMNVANPYYAYGTVPRAGGVYGGGSGWITGLRTPYYAAINQVHYSSYDRAPCGLHCYNRGYYSYAGTSYAYGNRIGSFLNYAW